MKQDAHILIILLGAIGDVVRGLPVATRLRTALPDARITWAVEPISESIVQGHTAIDRVVVFDRPRGLAGYREFIAELRKDKYDVVLDMQRHFKSGVTSLLSGSGRRYAFHRKNSREFNWVFAHEQIAPMEHLSAKVWQFQKFADHLGIAKTGTLDFGLDASSEEIAMMRDRLKNLNPEQKGEGASDDYVALILGSTWPSRVWPLENYCRFIEDLSQLGSFRPVLIGSTRELELANAITEQSSSSSVLNLVKQTSLRELVPLFSCCRFAVGSDSGPMHIAAAVGIPVVSLWGSTSPLRSRPEGNENYVLQSAIGCSPCYQKICPGLGTLCMSEIEPTAVLARLAKLTEAEGRDVSA